VKLVAAPNRRRYLSQELEHTSRDDWIIAQQLRTVDRVVYVRDDAVAPASDLVAEEAQRASPATTDRPFGDDTVERPNAQAPVRLRISPLGQ
jgi:hypothetical protein